MLRTDNITKRYNDADILKNITIDVSRDEILAVIGPSGCGKTTLLRVIAGLESPNEGTVVIDNVEVSTREQMISPSRRKLSMIFQDLAIWPHMTVGEHIRFVMNRNGNSKTEIANEVDGILQDVNLSGFGNRMPHRLSGGERQRLAIARALASKPVYLLMDEPFSSLDSIVKEELQELLLRLKSLRRMGILYVTHNIDEAAVLADRIAVMNNGMIEQIDSKEGVFRNPRNGFVRRILKIR